MPDLKMPRINKVIIAGRLLRDPELSYVGDGTPVCKMGLAHSVGPKEKEKVVFINITTWRDSALRCAERLKKGYPVIVEGKLEQSGWIDKETGAKRSETSINAFSVDGLTWENENGDKNAGGGGQQSGYDPQIQGDDMPF
jgi:single-strand DNA-binding protein